MRVLLEAFCRKGPEIRRPEVRMFGLRRLMYCPNCDAAYEAGAPTLAAICPNCGSRSVCAARLVPVGVEERARA